MSPSIDFLPAILSDQLEHLRKQGIRPLPYVKDERRSPRLLARSCSIDSASMLHSLQTMPCLRRVLAIALLALWGPVTLHCGLEVDGMWILGPNHGAKTVNPHASAVPDTDPEGCGAIESGHFDSFVASFVIVVPGVQELVFWNDLIEPALVVAPKLTANFKPPPLELTPTWAFHRRAALVPRAPSFAS